MKIKTFILLVLLTFTFGCERKVKKVPVTHALSSLPYVYFISQRDSLPTIYGINLSDYKIEKVLPDTFSGVWEIKFSPAGNIALFKTADFEGTVGAGFFSVKNPKIYLFDITTGEVALLKTFEDSWSVKIRWLNRDTVEVYRISGGYQTGENFKLEIYGFDPDGNLLYTKEKEYDWRKGEFPEEILDLKLSTPDGKRKVEIKEDSALGVKKIYVSSDFNNFEIFETRWKIEQLEWSPDGMYLVFRVVNITPEAVEKRNVKTGELYFFDVEKRNLYRISSGSGFFNFRFINDTQIIFDKGFENESEIYLYDLFKMEMKQLTNDDNPDGVSGIPKILGFSA
ncbi:hypothetical protein [Candidatus Kryptobacter tengchongensis]|uniref:hypothetical protein n=1 Tax=Kryptobacter tengchongensis TaxID=1643429 RepID=UPI0007073616|nr:hypothetical protein [Candidatus Kryptobacter tengchongensis]CUS80941.1 hypothetical protein JGI20_00665 [Candidatus Kryptobacter tengchongensis]